ncbi:MAG: ubiquinol-cytochrome c reductase iron-sulfur subunit [Acidobacteriota bacterium]
MTPNPISRRSFYPLLITVLGGAVVAVAGIPAAIYLLMKPRNSGGTDLVEIADINQLQQGKPEEIVYFRTRIDAWRRVKEKTTTWVVKTDASNVVAFVPQCTHLGCIYHWEAAGKNFICPCHASVFAIDGTVMEGPAPRPLDRYVTKVERGKVLVGPEMIRRT